MSEIRLTMHIETSEPEAFSSLDQHIDYLVDIDGWSDDITNIYNVDVDVLDDNEVFLSMIIETDNVAAFKGLDRHIDYLINMDDWPEIDDVYDVRMRILD